MISREEENKTKQVRENLRNQKSLYDTFKDVYDRAKPVSRILIMLKIVQVVDPQQKRKDKEKEKELNKETIPNFINELKNNLNQLNLPSNIMLIFVGTGYCFLGLENTTENIMNFVKIYKKKTEKEKDKYLESLSNIVQEKFDQIKSGMEKGVESVQKDWKNKK